MAIVDAGVGSQNAARAAADAIALHRPAWVVSSGFAGALVDDVKRGEFIIADSVADTHGNVVSLGPSFAAPQASQPTADGKKPAGPNWHVGRLLTVERLIRKVSEKRELAAAHSALACDMETFAVAEVCRRERTKFLSARIISDAVDDKLPPEAERLLGQKSLAFKLGAAFGAVLERPSSALDLWQMREDALIASDRLAKFLSGLARQLPVE